MDLITRRKISKHRHASCKIGISPAVIIFYNRMNFADFITRVWKAPALIKKEAWDSTVWRNCVQVGLFTVWDVKVDPYS
jgi:hypothetical protein